MGFTLQMTSLLLHIIIWPIVNTKILFEVALNLGKTIYSYVHRYSFLPSRLIFVQPRDREANLSRLGSEPQQSSVPKPSPLKPLFGFVLGKSTIKTTIHFNEPTFGPV